MEFPNTSEGLKTAQSIRAQFISQYPAYTGKIMISYGNDEESATDCFIKLVSVSDRDNREQAMNGGRISSFYSGQTISIWYVENRVPTMAF